MYSFLDLTSQYGGTAYTFMQSGFNIAGMYEQNNEAIEISNILHPELNVCPALDIDKLPYADVLFADISKILSDDAFISEPHKFIEHLFSHTSPNVFLFKLKIRSLRKQKNSIPTDILLRMLSEQYYLHYRVFKESEYSGFPIKGDQAYIVGIHHTLDNDRYYLPNRIHDEYSYKNIYEELEPNPDSWYRKLPKRLRYDGGITYRHFYQSDIQGTLHETNTISTHMMNAAYVCDDRGLRKFTHNEYALFKGYTNGVFNNCKNKNKTYNYIASLPNLYIIAAIAKSIYEFLNGYSTRHDIDYKRPTESNNIKSAEKAKDSRKSKPEKQLYFAKNRITNITITNLKGLSNLSIDISKNLVAIMGG